MYLIWNLMPGFMGRTVHLLVLGYNSVDDNTDIFIRSAVAWFASQICEIIRNSPKIHGYPRSSTLVSIESPYATSSLLLVINSNFGLSRTVVDTWKTQVACFPHLTFVWRTRSGETRQNFWMKHTAKKLERWGWKLHNSNFNRFDWSTRLTDKQTDER